jgi:hypothetical protein
MSFTARKLINKAYYLSGIVSRQLQTVSGRQTEEGLDLLNELIAVEGVTGSLISYFKEYSFNAVPGQELYFIPNLIQMETLTFNIDTVRYSMQPRGRVDYFGSGRADNIRSLPYDWRMERTKGGTNLYIYFLPETDYPMKIWGKFGLDEVTDLCDDLSLIYDKFYLVYFRYALARYICEDNDVIFQPQQAKKLAILEEKLTLPSPIDLSTRKRSMLQYDTGINYGDVNIGHGWRP